MECQPSELVSVIANLEPNKLGSSPIVAAKKYFLQKCRFSHRRNASFAFSRPKICEFIISLHTIDNRISRVASPRNRKYSSEKYNTEKYSLKKYNSDKYGLEKYNEEKYSLETYNSDKYCCTAIQCRASQLFELWHNCVWSWHRRHNCEHQS